MKLSILDQVRRADGTTITQTLDASLELAQVGEELGYERYWVAEHHNSETLVCPCPEVVLARVIANTCRIRLGAGGILLPHYSALKVAECFGTLEAMYPGKIDLGVGRALGCEIQGMHALRRYQSDRPFADDFPEQVAQLRSFVRDDFSECHPYRNLKVSPEAGEHIPIWVLGASTASATLAAQLGLRYAYAHFINPITTVEAFRAYRQAFCNRCVEKNETPRAILAVSAIAFERQEAVDELRKSAAVHCTHVDPRRCEQRPKPRMTWQTNRFVGTVDKVVRNISDAAAAAEADEVMVLTPLVDRKTALDSYRLLAAAFHLT